MMIDIEHVRELNKYFKSDYSGSFKAVLKNDCIEIEYVCGNKTSKEVTISFEYEYGGYCLKELNSSNMRFLFLEGIINVLREVDKRKKLKKQKEKLKDESKKKTSRD